MTILLFHEKFCNGGRHCLSIYLSFILFIIYIYLLGIFHLFILFTDIVYLFIFYSLEFFTVFILFTDTTCIPECKNGGQCVDHRCRCSHGYRGVVCQLGKIILFISIGALDKF